MSDDEYDTTCPLCVEEMDLSDQNFLPCPCGYKVCMWCWHHIRENLNGLCPACRTPYNSDPHAFSAVDREDVVKLKKEKKQKEKQEKKVGDRVIGSAPSGNKPPPTSSIVDRKHLHNYRVVQRNLVYVIGVPASYATEEILRKPEFFGQYGKIGKIVVHRNPSSAHTTVSVYITFIYRDDAKVCIQSLDGYWLDSIYLLRASFGTTKYCNNFIRGVLCNNPECVYLHELGEDDDRFTKEEIQAGHSKIAPVPGKDQTVVTGNGGPSGTGKRPIGDPVLPPPVFIQDNSSPNLTSMTAPTTTAAAGSTSTASSNSTGSSAMAVPPPPLGAPPGVGVGIVLGRPAPVSRSGTATWGNPNTLATIAGTAPVSNTNTDNTSTTNIERKRSGSTPVQFSGLQPLSHTHITTEDTGTPRGGRDRPITPTTPSTTTAPTAVLKRSSSNTTTNTTSTINNTTTESNHNDSNNPSTTTTSSTTNTTTTISNTTKIKPKTSKEIAAEKRAAIAAAKASLAAQIDATNDSNHDNNNTTTKNIPSTTINTTGKLTGRQQMLANKAAAKAAAVASLTASESQKSGNHIPVSSETNSNTNNTTTSSNNTSNNNDEKSTTTAESLNNNNNISIKQLEKPNITSDISDIFPEIPTITSLPLPTLPPILHTLTPIASTSLPVLNIPDIPYISPQFLHFNGISGNAVFPVPFSSLSYSVWGNILQASNEDLSVNPYGQLTTPLCELFDLTLPPTDAWMSTTPYWPRPLSYYATGMSTDGCTFTPAGKHNHHRSVADITQLPPIPLLPPNLSLNNKLDTPTGSTTTAGSNSTTGNSTTGNSTTGNSTTGSNTSIVMPPGIAIPPSNTETNNNTTSNNNTKTNTTTTTNNTTTSSSTSNNNTGRTVPQGPPGMSQPATRKEGSVDRMAREARESRQRVANNNNHSSNNNNSNNSGSNSRSNHSSSQNSTSSTPATTATGSNTSITALRQLFPGVKMSVNNGNK